MSDYRNLPQSHPLYMAHTEGVAARQEDPEPPRRAARHEEADDPKRHEYSDDEPEERKKEETESEASESEEEPDEGSALPTHYKFVLDLDGHKYTGSATLHTREKPYFFSAHGVEGEGSYPPSKIRNLIHSLKVTPKMVSKKGQVKILIHKRGSLRMIPR